MLRGTRKHLAQLIRRLSELNNFPRDLKAKRNVWESLKPGSQHDSFCLLSNGLVIKVTHTSAEKVMGNKLELMMENNDFANFYSVPVKSSSLDIYMAKKIDHKLQSWTKNDYPNAVKCIVMKFKDKFHVVFPIISFPV